MVVGKPGPSAMIVEQYSPAPTTAAGTIVSMGVNTVSVMMAALVKRVVGTAATTVSGATTIAAGSGLGWCSLYLPSSATTTGATATAGSGL